jgi:probable phosphoglycerate mutase
VQFETGVPQRAAVVGVVQRIGDPGNEDDAREVGAHAAESSHRPVGRTAVDTIAALFEQRRRIYLLRHGAVEYFDAEGTPLPSRTVPLTEEGRRQAEAMRDLLAEVQFDRAIISKLRRTHETAEIVLGDRELVPEQSDALAEIQTGKLRDIPERRQEAAFLGAFGPQITRRSRFLAGEAFGPFLERVRDGFDELLGDESWQNILLVLHGAVNRAILSQALGFGLRSFGALEQDPGCLNILDVGSAGIVVRLVNHTPYDPIKAGISMTTMEWLYRAYRPVPEG